MGGVGNVSEVREGGTPAQSLMLPGPYSEDSRGANGVATLQSCFPIPSTL